MFDTARSINPDEEISIKVDKEVFHLYASATKKNGRLAAYNELKIFTKNLKEELEETLEEIKESEKWFNKSIEFLYKWKRPYRVGDPTEAEIRMIEELKATYPDVPLKELWENYDMWGSLKLVSMLAYINNNKAFFKKVDSIDIYDKAIELYEGIVQLDFLYLMRERSKDLIQHLVKKRFKKKIKESDFIRTPYQLKKQNKSKPGPKTPEKLFEDIREILKMIKDPDQGPVKDEFMENEDLVINRVVEFALDYPPFYRNWIDEETASKKGGYSKRTLQTHFSDVYEIMKSSNSS